MNSRRSIRKAPEKREQFPRDNTKLKVIDYLYFKEGATRNEISKNAKIKTQSDDNFKIILDEMVEIKWLAKMQTKDVTIYTVQKEGKEALDHVKELIKKQHPLSKLSTFREIE